MIGELDFSNAVAFSFKGLLYSSGYISDSYNNVVEVIDSNWMRSLEAISQKDRLLRGQPLHHYTIMLSEHGYYEIAATGFKFTAMKESEAG